MFCEMCDKKIPIEECYYDLENNGHVFCSDGCVTDYLIYHYRLTIERNNGDNEE